MTDRNSDHSHNRNTKDFDTSSYTGPNQNTFGYAGSRYSHAYNTGTDPSSHTVTTSDSSTTGPAPQTPVGYQLEPLTINSMYSPYAPQQPLSPFTNPLYGGQHPPYGTATPQYPTHSSLGSEYKVQNLRGRYIRKEVLKDYIEERLDQFGEFYRIESLNDSHCVKALRRLSQDEIQHLQKVSYPGYYGPHNAFPGHRGY